MSRGRTALTGDLRARGATRRANRSRARIVLYANGFNDTPLSVRERLCAVQFLSIDREALCTRNYGCRKNHILAR